MKRIKRETVDASDLRRRAEAEFGARPTDSSAGETEVAPGTQRLLHELQVHQIELEMQNQELQRAQSEVEEGLSRYTDLYEFAPVGYLTLNREGEIQQVNLTGARLLGLPRARLVGKRLAVLVDADSRPVFHEFFTKVFDTGGRQACEVFVRPELASPFAVEFAGTSAAGGLECRVVATDITERKRAESLMMVRLRLQEFASSHSPKELLQKTLDEVEVVTSSRMAFFHYLEADQCTPLLQVWSTRTVTESVPMQEPARQFGVAGDNCWADCVRKRAPIVHNDDEKPRNPKGPPDARNTSMIRQVLVPILRKDRIVAILGVGNKPEGYTVTDVSTISFLADLAWEIAERRHAEEEREELQLQLAQAQKMEAIGTLAGGIAHDFNNILAGILGGLALIELEAKVDPGSKTDIQDMKALVKRGAELTKQLLGFARRGKFDLRPLDLARVVTKTSAMYGRTRTDITSQLDFEPNLLAVLMDYSQLEQVLLNLFVNAGQAMPGGGEIRLRATNAEVADKEAERFGIPSGLFVRLIISDSGAGMDARTLGRIFEPFFTTKNPGEGTGLGLASVFGIIKNHAGFIGVESEVGKGTTFTLLLPATERQAAEDKTPVAVLLPGTGTILVVDDEEQIVKVCARLLQKAGYDVMTASGGEQAIELVRQHGGKISLVLLDMTMPGMSGRQTYEAMRKLVPGIKVLLSSGCSVEGHAQELLDSGCNGFIQKPFEAETLTAKVRRLL